MHSKKIIETTDVSAEEFHQQIPVYIRRETKLIELVYLDFTNIGKLLDDLSSTLNIPKCHIMVIIHGRVLSANLLPKIQPYDYLDIIIRGRGGMQGKQAYTLITKQ